MREIVLDTETTGLNPATGDRIVEIGAVELVNHFPTGRTWHRYINPERAMPAEAFAVHGLSDDFLADKPLFASLADEFLQFVADARLVIHNAAFDMAFLNAELERCGRPAIPFDAAVDSLFLARRRHPAGPNNLDELCRRYGVDNSRRTHHGALLDAELLAEVYIELIGARQTSLGLADTALPGVGALALPVRPRPVPLPALLDREGEQAHRAFVASLGEKAIWLRYLEAEGADGGPAPAA